MAVALGLLVGWLAGGGTALWNDDTSSTKGVSGGSGSTLASWLLGIGVAIVVAAVVGMGLDRAARQRLLGRARRPAGGVGEESASANPEPLPRPEDESHRGSKTTP